MFFGALLLAAAPAALQAAESQAIQQFVDEFGAAAEVKVNAATGAARFVRLEPTGDKSAARSTNAAQPADARAVSDDFLGRHGAIFGLRDARAELVFLGRTVDAQGGVHLSYAQRAGGVPVFGAFLKTHLDSAGQLRVVNGITVPDVDADLRPARTAADAERISLAVVAGQAKAKGLLARGTTLVVYRAGLLKGVAGPNHLAWKVEVGNGADVREFVFVDAHTGKVVDQITGIHDAMFRRAYDGLFLPNPPPSYPASPFWVEGNPFPTPVAEANNMIVASQETYDLYFKAFGRDSWDGTGGMMDSIFNRGYQCPNASWNGMFISFCAGFTTDDVTGHEWSHAYTERTHGLIYQWQPGALNESYSDIFGETIDRINARGANDPGAPRDPSGANCSADQIFAPETRVNAPASIADDYPSGTSAFSPIITPSNTVTANVVRPNDGSGNPTDGCCGAGPDFTCAAGSWLNAADVVGKIVLVDRGLCGFGFKARNAELHGAAGVVIANVAASANPAVPPNMAGTAGVPNVAIPVTSMNVANGDLIRTALATDIVNATLQPNAPGTTDDTNRWLMGEDVNAVGLVGALRDMYRPTCFGDPGKVSDVEYTCSTADQGGVHTNSGVPNHAYALIVDGGTYNGETIAALGLTKAAHVYFRAANLYQGPTSDFADHADSIEQSCSDLIGVNLADLSSGAPSGEVLNAADCAEVAKALLAVEMRTPPTQCNFQPILAKNPPDRCEADTAQANVYSTDFETNPIGPWTVSHTAVVPADFTPRDWVWSNDLPDRSGSALFGVNFPGGTCSPGGDESGALQAFSPVITLPPGAANPRLTFDHWIATEGGWDGGNLKISVNGGPWQVVAAADYTYNPYNATLNPAPGNTDPLAGQPAFTGTDGGAVGGSWGRSHVNLAPYAGPGSTVQLQFDLGNDGCTGIFGWYVDDPTLYACVPADPPLISIADASVAEGNQGLTAMDFRVTLSHASAEPVEVLFITLPGTALPLLDFVPDIGKLTIAPLQLEGRIRVKVVGDRFRERDESLYVLLFAPHGGAILDGVGAGKIVNDDGGGH